ncbi:MAG: hypothetical protein Q8N26_36200 [Myxococcales bacterium]|nr:hypothetical protein [Myxococcales bacterium]
MRRVQMEFDTVDVVRVIVLEPKVLPHRLHGGRLATGQLEHLSECHQIRVAKFVDQQRRREASDGVLAEHQDAQT